jgi:hypothetical protein
MGHAEGRRDEGRRDEGRGDVRRADDIGRRSTRRGGGDGRLSFREGIGIALAVLVIVFAVLNLEDANVDLIVDTVTLPLILVIAGCSAVGFLLGFLVARRRPRDRD